MKRLDSGSGLDDGAGRKILAIGPFRLDECAAVLYRGSEALPVGRRAVALLSVLAKHREIVVSKDQLIEAAWPGIAVEESNLTVQVAALRRALASEPGAECWIETMPRRGYRYVGPALRYRRPGEGEESVRSCTVETPNGSANDDRLGLANGEPVSTISAAVGPSSCLVGRANLLGLVDQLTRCVIAGRRKVAFVTGEAGIGKTAFVERAMERLSRQGLDLLYGRCTERFGTGEAFLPLIDALMTRSRQPNNVSLLTALRTYAPTWMLQLPGVISARERAAFQEEVFGATRERMVREFCDLMEVMSAERPWVIVLEDLHWCDLATLDVLSRFARGSDKARVMVLGSYRPTDSAIGGHPIRRLHQDLEIHEYCEELRLDRLSRTEVEQYLTLRFTDEALASTMAEAVFERTQGQPLFISSLLKRFIDQGTLVEKSGRWRLTSDIAIVKNEVPNDLIKMITFQLDNLTENERNLLSIASAAGVEFSASLVAAGLSRDTVEVERDLEALARNDHVLVPSGASEWPDGAYSGAYTFGHVLYQNVLYQQLAPGLRVQTHRRLGKRLEEAYSGRTREIAAMLAFHFEQGRDFALALQYLSQAAENSTRRLGHEEAINYLTRALDILDRVGGAEHTARIGLLRQRSWARRSAGDLVGSVGDLRQMIACTVAAGELRQEVSGLLAVSRFTLHADRRVCLQASAEALRKSEAIEDNAFKALVQGSGASTNLWLKGWRDEDAALCEEALRVTAGARDHGMLIRRYGIEGILECLRSRYEACSRAGTDGKRLAREVGDVYIFVLFNVMESTALIHLGQWRRLQHETVAALALAERNANRPAIVLCRLTLAWLHVEAMDFDGARDLCERADETVLEENPFAFFFQRAVLAKAFVGLNEPQRARTQFEDVWRRLRSDEIMLDYTIYAQLHHCLGEYSIHVGDIGQARDAANKLRDYVARAPDLNHLAQALSLLARVACAAGDMDEARMLTAGALSLLDNTDMPLAAWRVYRAAGEICATLGEAGEAARYRACFEQVIRKLADNFDAADGLRSSLLAALDAPLP